MGAIDLLTTQLTDCFSALTVRINDMEKNLEEKLLRKIDTHIDKKIDRLKLNIDKDISTVKSDMVKIEKTCSDAIENVKRSYADAIKSRGETNDITRDTNIVIRNLRESADERDDPSVVKHKVEKLLRDGLKLANVKIVEAKRKPGWTDRRGDRPGIIIATVETKEQKTQLMKAKIALRESRDYRSVYIENDLTVNELQTQSSLRTILRELGRERDYFVTGSRIVHRSEERRSQTSHNGTYANRGGHVHQGDSHAMQSKGGNSRRQGRPGARNNNGSW
jgi:hypothetical protein